MKKFIERRITLAVLFIIGINSINCYSQFWQKVPGPNNYIFSIFFPVDNPDVIAVSSNSTSVDFQQEDVNFRNFGHGFKMSTDKGASWGEYILDQFNVLDFIQAPNSPETWLASVSQLKRGAVLTSTDHGINWDTLTLNCESSYQIIKFAANNFSGEYFCGAAVNTSNGFISSQDRFQNCLSHSNPVIRARDIRISKKDTSSIFVAGGQFLGGGVFRTTDYGTTWSKDSSGLEGLRVLCILASSHVPNLLYAGCDSLTMDKLSIGKGIYRSEDTGKTWKRVAAEGARVFSIAEHPQDPRYIVAACGEDGVWMSANWGAYWEKFNDGFPQNASVRQIAIPNWNPAPDGIIAFAGVFGEGLYKSGRMITKVEDRTAVTAGLKILSKYPVPFNDKFNLVFNNNEYRQITIAIRDQLGRKLYETSGNYEPGDHNFIWQPNDNISDGIYFITIESGYQTITSKIIRLK